MPFWCFLSIDGARIPLPFRIFSGDGGTDLDVKPDLTKVGAGMVEEEAEEEVMVVVVAEFILTLAPSAFTRLGIFSRLTTGTGTLQNQRKILKLYFLYQRFPSTDTKISMQLTQ